MKRFLITLLSATLLLTGCRNGQDTRDDEAERIADSLALHVAVMPVISALPVYYAQCVGLTDSVGLDMRLLHHTSQMDIDTTVVNGHAELYLTDAFRLAFMPKQCALRPVAQGIEPLSFYAHKNLRVTKLNQLKERMVAIARHSVTDAWMDHLLDSVKLPTNDVYRPQINDVHVRFDMLRTELMETAILTEPYASCIAQEGHKRLANIEEGIYATSLWVGADTLANDAHRKQQIEQFIDMYNRAVRQMNAGMNTDTVRVILCREYALPQEMVDSLTLVQLTSIAQPDSALSDRAKAWMNVRQKARK